MTVSSLQRSVCRACGELIYWVHTDHGQRMPIDVDPSERGNLLLSAAQWPPRVSVVSAGGRPPGALLYISHFATCRFARLHRRPLLAPAAVTLFSEAGR